ncbi:beta-fructofuranosidase [Streptococcus suis]|uniref:Sucrose-6-phosphate hydrolase n=1 Tax=Streptococcus suis TaxID=1307 RepID=A0A0Z8HMJ3_STRSU|nr:glycoside hydrolase family 32 protein [Streptococcus suis]NQH36796.1 glycoside hydrolase family 32 protein [Streptococcus suis]CYV19812.1 beta-fructofuranosidase [Streptococcus suis]HEM2770388.1 glycoside hydrolase family 32 protein [Streptococcus suis]HEM5155216.1 glycoside hydrolase family 32 protein [Streptococcus suis]HEM5182818.1 glycoside hydrolase family 32 protein [Streptococcus suis]
MENLYKNYFHLEAPRGLLNDPNGLTYFQGTYYVFHQWNRFDLHHGYKEWGLFTSKDLIDWQHQGSALLPDSDKDVSGVYSGSALVIEDKLHIFYTGNSKIDGKRRSLQCQAISADGKTFQKINSPITTPEVFTEHHRDPKIWTDTNGYHMIVGSQMKNGQGAIAYYQSTDGREWSYRGIFYTSENLEQMAECPDYFELDGQSILLVCPQKRDLEKDTDLSSYSAYYMGNLQKNEFCPQTDIQAVDDGFDFYAPQTFLDPKGRRLMWAWMSRMNSKEEEACPTRKFGYLHCLTMPRELKVIDGKLYQLPLQEILESRKRIESLETTHYLSKDLAAQSVIEMTWDESPLNLELALFDQQVTLEYKNQELILSRKSWSDGHVQSKKVPLKELKALQIFIDSSAMELFINQGEKVMSLRYFLEQENRSCDIRSSHQMEISYSKLES